MVIGAHHRFTWSGVFGEVTAPLETWQFSLKTPDDFLATQSNMDTLAAAARTCYVENLRSLFSPNVTLTEVEAVGIDAGGKYDRLDSGAYVQGFWRGSDTGQAAQGARFPLQTALTISLTSSRPGPTGKGRFFLPWPQAGLDAGHRIESGVAQVFANACAEFVRDVGLISGPVSIFSSKGYSSPVTGVKVGRVPDTMRSRRGDMVEGYVAAPV